MAAVWGFPKKHFLVQNHMEVVKSDGETIRSLYICGGARSGHWKRWGEF